ncbi:MAG: hypothetical protein EBS65_22045, partial [Betaproteobacteria bacterium]|nr:hypothetical protein [Betaproteobacteria bacterium]
MGDLQLPGWKCGCPREEPFPAGHSRWHTHGPFLRPYFNRYLSQPRNHNGHENRRGKQARLDTGTALGCLRGKIRGKP